MAILTTHHAWYTWTDLAIRHERHALRARESRDIYEYRPGLIAITSSAFALDALDGVAKELIPDPGAKGSLGAKIGERVKRGVSPGKLAQSWPNRIGDLFKLRREAVHFNEETVAPVWHEAYQTNVDPSVIRWGADAATVAVDLALEVLDAWATYPSRFTRPGRPRTRPACRPSATFDPAARPRHDAPYVTCSCPLGCPLSFDGFGRTSLPQRLGSWEPRPFRPGRSARIDPAHGRIARRGRRAATPKTRTVQMSLDREGGHHPALEVLREVADEDVSPGFEREREIR
jgi:hypothetical protein